MSEQYENFVQHFYLFLDFNSNIILSENKWTKRLHNYCDLHVDEKRKTELCKISTLENKNHLSICMVPYVNVRVIKKLKYSKIIMILLLLKLNKSMYYEVIVQSSLQ